MTTRTVTLLSVLLLLAACGKNENEPPAPKLFKDQRDVLDKAKDVGAEQQKQEEEKRKAVEQQSQ